MPTNMVVLVGEKLRGALGLTAAIIGICLPGAVLMYVVGIFYRIHGDHIPITAVLKGGGCGCWLDPVYCCGDCARSRLKASLLCFRLHSLVIAVNRLHQSVLRTLIGVGLLAILFHRAPATIRKRVPLNEPDPRSERSRYLSLLTVGGGMAAFPEMKISTVEGP